MPKVHKTIDEAAKHLGESVSVIPGRYKEATGKASWEDPASSPQAEANYSAGVSEAIAEGRRVTGIHAAGDTKYRKGCAEKGAPVIGGRITAALSTYRTEFSPILGAMNAASDAAPPRTRDPMANIDARLKPVVAAAIAAKK